MRCKHTLLSLAVLSIIIFLIFSVCLTPGCKNTQNERPLLFMAEEGLIISFHPESKLPDQNEIKGESPVEREEIVRKDIRENLPVPYENKQTIKKYNPFFISFFKNAAYSHFSSLMIDKDLWEKRGLFYQGWSALRRNEWDNALQWFQKSLKETPYLRDYTLIFMAQCRENKGEYNEAAALLSQVITGVPASPVFPEAKLKLADIYFSQGEYGQAIKVYKECINLFPKKEEYIRYQIGIASLKEDTEAAQEIFMSLIKKRPDSPFSKLAREYIKGLPNGEKILASLSPAAEHTLENAERLFKKGRYESAIQVLGYILKKRLSSSDKCQAQYLLAQCYKKRGKQDQAIKELEKLIKTKAQNACLAEAQFFLARLFWNKHRNKEALQHLKFLEKNPLWERQDELLSVIGRIAEEEERFQDALRYYQQLINEYSESAFFLQTLWKIGWIYYIQGQYNEAATYFETYSVTLEEAALRQKFLYWAGKSYDMTGKWRNAEEVYKKILNEEYWSYYSGLAEIRLGCDNGISHPYFNTLKEAMETSDIFPSLNNDEEAIIHRIWELSLLGLQEDALNEIHYYAFSYKGASPGLLYSLGSLAHMNEDYALGIRIGIIYNKFAALNSAYSANPSGSHGTVALLLYPPGFFPQVKEKSEIFNLDPLLVLSIIRQESLFDPFSLSPASAYGLMQVIPPTGAESARELDIELDSDITCLYDKDLNITLGCYYFKKMLDTFENNLESAIAAYNAGPYAVKTWLKRFGNRDKDEFVEFIPYNETREYVMRVKKNYLIYKKLMEKGNKLD